MSKTSWQEIHDAWTARGLVDPLAPVQAEGEIEIDASPDRVWDVLTAPPC
jgi:hypothetical protein